VSDAADGPLARAVFALLVVGCFVAFFLTYHLNHAPTAVQRFQMLPVFSPTPHGANKVETISFKLDHADEATVTVLSVATGRYVATLASDRPMLRYHQTDFRWNGHTGPRQQGPLAPGGYYRVRVHLRHQGATVLSPHTFHLALGSGSLGSR
jgi:hypothetical protein